MLQRQYPKLVQTMRIEAQKCVVAGTVCQSIAHNATLKTEEFFKERRLLADINKFKGILYRDDGVIPSEGDELSNLA